MKHTLFILTLLLVRATHALSLNINTQLERRNFIQTSTAATIASTLLGANQPAYADPMNALIPVGSGALRQQPYVVQSESWKEPVLTTKLGMSRIGSNSLSPIQQKPFAAQDVFYPSFFVGSWEIESTLVQKLYPFGPDFAPSKSLIEGSPRNRNEQVGSMTKYQAKFFSMTAADGSKVDLSLGIDKTKTIADRRFNSISMSRAYQQLTPIEEVGWDYNADPTRLSLRFSVGPLTDDMRPLGQRRGEVYLIARQTEVAENGSFCAAERSRSVIVGPGTVTAMDQESITEFQPQSDGSVHAISRVAVYLTPNPNSREGVLWQQVNGKAVAFFDYTWKMKPILETAEAGGS